MSAARRRRRRKASAGWARIIAIAMFGILGVLVVEFGRFRETAVVAGVIPLGMFGGLVALFVTGNSLSYTAVIGFVALIGIEIKNSILLVDFTTQLRAAGHGAARSHRASRRSALPAGAADLRHGHRRAAAAGAVRLAACIARWPG